MDQTRAGVYPPGEGSLAPGLKRRLARNLLLRSLQGLTSGSLELETAEGFLRLGNPEAELFQRRGLEDRVTLLQMDYRHLRGSFDKMVSIEMFEAVGLRYYDSFFAAAERLLRPGGTFLLQTITMNEQHFPDYVRGTDWIQQWIFPGAELASVAEILFSTARVTSLSLEHLEEIGLHYARTLHHWRERFLAHKGDVRALGFDEKFLRTWDYYLAYCEGAFAERYIGDAQLLFRKGNSA